MVSACCGRVIWPKGWAHLERGFRVDKIRLESDPHKQAIAAKARVTTSLAYSVFIACVCIYLYIYNISCVSDAALYIIINFCFFFGPQTFSFTGCYLNDILL